MFTGDKLQGFETREEMIETRLKESGGRTPMRRTSQATPNMRKSRYRSGCESGLLSELGRDRSNVFSQDTQKADTIHEEFSKRVRGMRVADYFIHDKGIAEQLIEKRTVDSCTGGETEMKRLMQLDTEQQILHSHLDRKFRIVSRSHLHKIRDLKNQKMNRPMTSKASLADSRKELEKSLSWSKLADFLEKGGPKTGESIGKTENTLERAEASIPIGGARFITSGMKKPFSEAAGIESPFGAFSEVSPQRIASQLHSAQQLERAVEGEDEAAAEGERDVLNSFYKRPRPCASPIAFTIPEKALYQYPTRARTPIYMLERLQKNGAADDIRSRRRRPESRQEPPLVLPLDLSLLDREGECFLADPFASPVPAAQKDQEAAYSKMFGSRLFGSAEQQKHEDQEASPHRPSYFKNVYISKEKGGKAESVRKCGC